MKKICVVGYNFGTKYQSFIPIYIYSILINYPEYSVIIFSDTSLENRVREMLKIIEGIGDFEIVENYKFGVDAGSRINNILTHKQAVRWLFYDERFSEFESIYIGDIDIFICKESGGIYNQHLIHCDSIGLPYSNYVRLTVDDNKLTIKMLLYYIKTRQFSLLKSKIKREPITEKRLTGLHFVKTREYYEKVIPLFPKFIKEITNHKSILSRNDEALLYDLVDKSGLGLPPISPNSPGLEYAQPECVSFRPHHGIHLGIFRNSKTVLRQRQVLDSYVYKEYFNQYIELKRKDYKLRNLIELSNDFVKELFEKVEEYYLR